VIRQPSPTVSVTKRTCRLAPVCAALSLYAASISCDHARNDGTNNASRDACCVSRTYITWTRLPALPSPSQTIGFAATVASATSGFSGRGSPCSVIPGIASVGATGDSGEAVAASTTSSVLSSDIDGSSRGRITESDNIMTACEP
jgi:hypothetical protein